MKATDYIKHSKLFRRIIDLKIKILTACIIVILTSGGVLAFVWPELPMNSNTRNIQTGNDQKNEPKQELIVQGNSLETNSSDENKPEKTEESPVSEQQIEPEPEYMNANEVDAYVRDMFKNKLIECTVDVSRQQTYAGYYWIHYDAMKAGQPYITGPDGTALYEKYYKYIIDNNIDRVKTRYLELLNNGDEGVINYVTNNQQYNRCKAAMGVLADDLPATHTVCDEPHAISEDSSTTEQNCRQVLD